VWLWTCNCLTSLPFVACRAALLLVSFIMNYMEQLCLGLARLGRVPNHIAFIMDGNRRYATKRGKKGLEGHSSGYSSLLKVLEWCLFVDLKVVTVYAFSIDNFKRPKEEVDRLMTLAEEKFTEFLSKQELVMKYGVRVRILGDLSLLPEKVRKAAATVMVKTAHHEKLTLNICFSYTSGEEVSSTIRDVVDAARNGELKKSDIDPLFLEKCLYTRGSSPDLLVRTSGETRLSDFLIWQLNRAHLCFLDVTWPEISVWHFLMCLWEYQAHHMNNDKTLENCDLEKEKRQLEYIRAREIEEIETCKAWM